MLKTWKPRQMLKQLSKIFSENYAGNVKRPGRPMFPDFSYCVMGDGYRSLRALITVIRSHLLIVHLASLRSQKRQSQRCKSGFGQDNGRSLWTVVFTHIFVLSKQHNEIHFLTVHCNDK